MHKLWAKFIGKIILLLGITTLFSFAFALDNDEIPIYEKEIKNVQVLAINGPVSRVESDYITSNIQKINRNGKADLIIIQLNSTGDSVPYSRVIAEKILDSKIPVVVFVSPNEAQIANFSILILYAANITAMTPTSVILPPMIEVNNQEETMVDHTLKLGMTVYIVKLASIRDRSTKVAADIVSGELKYLTAAEALEKGVIDLQANNIKDLLQKLNDRIIEFNGLRLNLNTEFANVSYKSLEPSPLFDFLNAFVSPTITYLFFIIFIYCLGFVVLKLGSAVPKFIGSICLFLSLYGFYQLPITLMGFALLISGVLFLVLDLISSIHIIFIVLGIISFFFGSSWLYTGSSDIFNQLIPFNIVILITISTVLFFSFFMRIRLRNKHRIKMFDEIIQPSGVGGTVVKCKGKNGVANFDGEIWRIISVSAKMSVGDVVYPAKRHGLILIVNIQEK